MNEILSLLMNDSMNEQTDGWTDETVYINDSLH